MTALAGCWLQPGFDSRRGAFNPSDSTITPANIAGLHAVWTRTVGGPLVTTPTVSTDAVYVRVGNVQDLEGTLFALNRSDGTSRWTATVFGNQCCGGLPTTLANGAVYVPSGSSQTEVFDALTGAEREGIGLPADEVIAHDSRLIGTLKECHPGNCATTLSVYDTAGSGSWHTLLDLTTLNEGGSIAVATPAVSATRVIIGRNSNVQSWPLAPPSNCTPVLPGVDQQSCPPTWSRAVAAKVAGHPVLSSDDATVYAAAGTNVYALDAATGTQRWSGTLGAAASAAPALANGSLYVPTSNGDLKVFSADGCGHATCSRVWTAHTASSISQQPAVTSGGIVYVASVDGVLRAYPAAGCGHVTCTSLWSAATGSTITGGPVAALGNVYIGTQDGRVIAYGV